MKHSKYWKIFLCLVIAFSISLRFVIPVTASQLALPSANTGSFFSFLIGKAQELCADNGLSAIDYLKVLFSTNDSGCPNSNNGCHHWTCGDPTLGLIANSFEVHCISCGLDYREYKTGTAGPVTEQDLLEMESEYVSTLPADNIKSSAVYNSIP